MYWWESVREVKVFLYLRSLARQSLGKSERSAKRLGEMDVEPRNSLQLNAQVIANELKRLCRCAQIPPCARAVSRDQFRPTRGEFCAVVVQTEAFEII